MNDTPICDASWEWAWQYGSEARFIPLEKAQEIERDLAARDRRIAELEQRDAVRKTNCMLYREHGGENGMPCAALREAEQRAETAERELAATRDCYDREVDLHRKTAAERDEARRDAERYDYILRNPWRAIDLIRKSVNVNVPADWHTQLNAAIDAAKERT